MALTFEWDEEKAQSNLKKHDVSFEEARTVFGDPLSITMTDPRHSAEEERYIDIGMSASGRLLVVVYTERGAAMRIINSRKAAAREREVYEEQI